MPTVWTIGHSNRPLEGFLELLRHHGLRRVVDVRRDPGSRRHPHFAKGSLSAALDQAGLAYRHAPELGGHREPRPDSPHTAWTEDAFRGYADHMDTAEFAEGLTVLLGEAASEPTTVMCAEADWVRCHRGLLSDRLLADGVTVLHVRDHSAPVEHPYTAAARLVDGRLSYVAPVQGGLFPDD